MPWSNDPIDRRHPTIQLGWELIGDMVEARRVWLGWSQRDLGRWSGTSQPVISRLENGRLRGLKFKRFAAIVAVLGGLEREAPRPPRRSVHPELLEPERQVYGPPGAMITQWLPCRDGGSYTRAGARTPPRTPVPPPTPVPARTPVPPRRAATPRPLAPSPPTNDAEEGHHAGG